MLQEAAWFGGKSGTCSSSWFNNIPINAALGFPPRGRWQADLKSSLSDCFNDSTAVLSYTRRWSEAAFWATEIRRRLEKRRHQLFSKRESFACWIDRKKKKKKKWGEEFLSTSFTELTETIHKNVETFRYWREKKKKNKKAGQRS